ncbi:hypothetical protein KMW28_07620 [Flammeovirga yaeyamensis]|uniref:Lipoprotein n=1 Tax=Flammeovirga yaeyamensis TaxID=367791 RepID=A0AAX1N797_9BACT|nr:hypothetical protein [Flammeovirga yaeyamensis]MBB3698050.1 hypothetical protein [Flammeovirga yaeyamensis]NMF35598.1 hypothetical protein [Flammeovirga yaeyamensis]QWG03444.1 hypothetical protein KMW28_07620 [Flammeovirga yaeyamensis]
MKINQLWRYLLLIGLTFSFLSCDEETGEDDINPEDVSYLYFTTDGDLTEIKIQNDSLPGGEAIVPLPMPLNIQVKFDIDGKMMYISTKSMLYSDDMPVHPEEHDSTSQRLGMSDEGTWYFEESSVALTSVEQNADFSWSFYADESAALTYKSYLAETCEMDEEGEDTIGEAVDASSFFKWDEEEQNYYISLRELFEIMEGEDDSPEPGDDIDNLPADGTRAFMDSTDVGEPDNLPELFDIKLWAKDGDLKGCEENK